ncbi:MAG: methyltransferase domain-containing protein [Gammaproteobacteria bacterium]|nr:methyltransferase domain-containing protein [Gammaproteobacteria bacterium]
MAESWDDYAETWDTDDAVNLYSEKAFQSLNEVIDISGLRVLDFGCGTGLLSEKLAPEVDSIVAIDPSVKMVSVLESKNIDNIHTIASELTPDLAEQDELFAPKFDLIVASSVMAFVDDYSATLRLLKTLLRPGGSLVHWDWLKMDDDSSFGFSAEEVSEAFNSSGFSDVSVTLPFVLESKGESMKVVMGVGKNSG